MIVIDRNQVRVILIYIVLSSFSHILNSLIASLSEYRFPHPLITTTLHLILSSTTLFILSFTANILLHSNLNLHLLTPLLRYYAIHSPSPSSSLLSSLTPFTLSSSLCAILASLAELRALKISDPRFWNLAKLLPLLVVFLVNATRGHFVLQGLLVWLILVAGKGVSWNASREAWLCAGVSSVAVSGWVWSVKAGWKESEEDSNKPPPTVLSYLAITTVLLLPPLILSNEFSEASQSGHFRFFTEPGFWFQELGMALCGLTTLVAFWGLIKNLEPLSVFIVVGLKDTLLPYLYYWFFGNHLDPFLKPTLRPGQQLTTLLAVGAYTVVSKWDKEVPEKDSATKTK